MERESAAVAKAGVRALACCTYGTGLIAKPKKALKGISPLMQTLILNSIYLQSPLDVYKLEEGVASFYEANLSTTAQQVRDTFEETMGQSVNPKWFLARRNRITASIAHKVLQMFTINNLFCTTF
jgi:hypothetical protein